MHDIDALCRATAQCEAGVRDPARAEATARAALRTCRDALDILLARLQEEGFPTRIPGRIRVDPRDVETAVDLLPERPPRVLQLFWEQIGAIRLADSYEESHADFFRARGIFGASPHRTTDALWVNGPEPGWIECLHDRVESWRDEWADDFDDDEVEVEPFLISLSPDHYHKDNISGGGPYGIELGDDDWQPTFGGDFAWIGHRRPESVVEAGYATDFVSYRRAGILECAGFPGLYGNEEFEPLRRRLVEDLPVF